MKKILVLILLLAVFGKNIHAQSIAFGPTVGYIHQFDANTPKDLPKYTNMSKGIFFRWNTKGRISVNAGISTHKYFTDNGPHIILDVPYRVLTTRTAWDYLCLNYSIQYNITPVEARNIKLLKNINNYIGFEAAQRLVTATELSNIHYYYGGIDTRSKKYGSIDNLMGINYSITYTYKHLIIQSTSSIMLGFADYNNHFFMYTGYPASNVSIDLGVGYKF